jgi:hypothetical protein
MRLETRGSLQFSGDSRLEALESSLLGPRTQGLCPWVLGAAGDCPGVVSEVVSGVVSGTSEVGDSLLRLHSTCRALDTIIRKIRYYGSIPPAELSIPSFAIL